jgi:hypothetical protein
MDRQVAVLLDNHHSEGTNMRQFCSETFIYPVTQFSLDYLPAESQKKHLYYEYTGASCSSDTVYVRKCSGRFRSRNVE